MEHQLDTSSARSFNSSLKKLMTELTGQKMKVEIINSYKFPNCNVRIHPEPNKKIPNDLRLQIFHAAGNKIENLKGDISDIYYGVITSTWSSAHVKTWQILVENLNNNSK